VQYTLSAALTECKIGSTGKLNYQTYGLEVLLGLQIFKYVCMEGLAVDQNVGGADFWAAAET
jgi:hypothetical protein